MTIHRRPHHTLMLLTQIKTAKNLPSWYALAKHLGLDERRLSEYRQGKRMPPAYTCALIADALGMRLGDVIAQVHADLDPDPTRRKAWMKRAASAPAQRRRR